MTNNPYFAVPPVVEATPKETGREDSTRSATFVALTFVGIALFPVALVCSLLSVMLSDEMPSLMLIVYVILHAAITVVGLIQHHNALRLLLPITLAAIAIFGYNRHWLGQPNNSPFSNGIGTVDQRAYGVFAWLRRFDQPFAEFGDFYSDWTAFAMNAELAIAVAAFLLIASNRWKKSHGQCKTIQITFDKDDTETPGYAAHQLKAASSRRT